MSPTDSFHSLSSEHVRQIIDGRVSLLSKNEIQRTCHEPITSQQEGRVSV